MINNTNTIFQLFTQTRSRRQFGWQWFSPPRWFTASWINSRRLPTDNTTT